VPFRQTVEDDHARYLLYMNAAITDTDPWNISGKPLTVSFVLDRCFVDIGCGTPSDFLDLVPTDLMA